MIIRQPYPNELYHHGIKGMNWGVRRFQNEDGSLTDAGRRRYGIFGRLGSKRKVSKAAKLRAKQRVKTKNDEARKAALEAETARLNAQREAEEAKTQLRAAKKENSLLNRAAKLVSKKESKERPVKESKNSKKLAAAIEAGNDKKVSKILKDLNTEEYATALKRINMKYEMDLAKKKYNTGKMQEAVNKLNQFSYGAAEAVNIYNVVAGVGSAFTGKNIPKINTKPTDPLKQIEQMYKNRTQKATSEKAEAMAKKEKLGLAMEGEKYRDFMKKRKKEQEEPKPETKPDKPSLSNFITPGATKDTDESLSKGAKDAIKGMMREKNKSNKKPKGSFEDFITPGSAKDTKSSKPKSDKKYKKGQNITEDNWEDFFEQMNNKFASKVKDSDVLNARMVNPKRGKAAKDDPNKTYGRPAEVVDIVPDATFLPAVRPSGGIDVSRLPKNQQDLFWRFMNGV